MPSSHLHAFIDQFEGLHPDIIQPKTFLRSLAALPDPRAKRGIRHPLARILVIVICAVIAGAKSLVEIAEWAQDTAPTTAGQIRHRSTPRYHDRQGTSAPGYPNF